jgi:type IV secretory pathway TrbD component
MQYMKPNMGNADRIIRIILGLAIIVVGVIYQSWWGALGVIPILTAVVRWCPAYVPFNINTGKKE